MANTNDPYQSVNRPRIVYWTYYVSAYTAAFVSHIYLFANKTEQIMHMCLPYVYDFM